jgi:hypothetical protein
MPADQPAHGEASARAGDLIGALIERLGEIRHARSAIDQGEQHAQFRGGQPAPLEQFKYAVKRGLRNGWTRSVARACPRDAGWLGMRSAGSGPADVMVNHGPMVAVWARDGNGYQPASRTWAHRSERATGPPLAVARTLIITHEDAVADRFISSGKTAHRADAYVVWTSV